MAGAGVEERRTAVTVQVHVIVRDHLYLSLYCLGVLVVEEGILEGVGRYRVVFTPGLLRLVIGAGGRLGELRRGTYRAVRLQLYVCRLLLAGQLDSYDCVPAVFLVSVQLSDLGLTIVARVGAFQVGGEGVWQLRVMLYPLLEVLTKESLRLAPLVEIVAAHVDDGEDEAEDEGHKEASCGRSHAWIRVMALSLQRSPPSVTLR